MRLTNLFHKKQKDEKHRNRDWMNERTIERKWDWNMKNQKRKQESERWEQKAECWEQTSERSIWRLQSWFNQ